MNLHDEAWYCENPEVDEARAGQLCPECVAVGDAARRDGKLGFIACERCALEEENES